jgi:hypothetical protein
MPSAPFPMLNLTPDTRHLKPDALMVDYLTKITIKVVPYYLEEGEYGS